MALYRFLYLAFHLFLGPFRQVLTFELPTALKGQVIGLGKPDWLRPNTSVKLIFAS